MKKWQKNLLSLSNLAKNLGVTSLFSAVKFNYHIEIKNELEFKRILVLAPHPDDDVFGCGGTLKKIADGGGNITVAYFCDGSGGGTAAVRKEEAKKSAEILGIQKPARHASQLAGVAGGQVFFGYPDGKLASGTSVIKALSDLIKDINPDIIFVPSFLDNHPDHRVVNEILINVLSAGKFNGEIWAYEVWTTIFPNRIVNISSAIEDKKKAMAAHKSQLEARGYDKAILGLNQYRAEINNFPGYGEAFFACKFSEYQKLHRKS